MYADWSIVLPTSSMHNFNFHNYPVSFLFVISAVHHRLWNSAHLPLGDGLEIAKLIVQDQTMQDSLGIQLML